MQELKRYFSYIGAYKYRYWLILVVTVLASAAMDLLYSYMNKLFFNSLEYADRALFTTAAGICVLLVVLRCLFPYLRYFEIKLVRKLVFDIKIRLFHKLMKLDMSYYEGHHSTDALKTLNWDANSLKDSYFSHVYWVLGKLVSGVAAVIAMLLYSPLLALVSVAFCLITVYTSVRINGEIKRMDKKIQEGISRLTQRLSDILSGFALLKMYPGASIVLEHFYEENEGAADKERQKVNKAAMLEIISFLLGILGSFGTIVAGTVMVTRGYLDYGTVMAVVSLQMNVSGMMQRLGASMTTLSGSLVKAGSVFDFLEMEAEEQGLEAMEKVAEIEQEGSVEALSGQGDRKSTILEIRKLGFFYEEGKSDKWVLNGLDMQAEAGEKILLMGKSGCGKSTLLKLLLRFYESSWGEILVCGRDIRTYSLKELRKLITYVPQSNYLFAGTIGENIAMGCVDRNVTEGEIKQAAKLAYADEFISQFPQGYETHVEAGGSNLSGGQRQRIAIARAFLKNSPILLMDEPSSALDVQSEKKLQLSLQQLMKNKVVLMVTHRETFAEEFDRVIRL